MRLLNQKNSLPFSFVEFDKFLGEFDELCRTPKEKFYAKMDYLENKEKCRYTINLAGADKDSLILSISPNENKFSLTANIVKEDLDGNITVTDTVKLSYKVNNQWDLENKPLRTEYKNGILYIEFGICKEKEMKTVDIKFT